jgi:hypothetical protein
MWSHSSRFCAGFLYNPPHISHGRRTPIGVRDRFANGPNIILPCYMRRCNKEKNQILVFSSASLPAQLTTVVVCVKKMRNRPICQASFLATRFSTTFSYQKCHHCYTCFSTRFPTKNVTHTYVNYKSIIIKYDVGQPHYVIGGPSCIKCPSITWGVSPRCIVETSRQWQIRLLPVVSRFNTINQTQSCMMSSCCRFSPWLHHACIVRPRNSKTIVGLRRHCYGR